MLDSNMLFLIGRVLYGGFFINSALNHFRHTKMLAGYAQSKGVTSPQLAVQATGILLLVGGLSVLVGYEIMWGILALVIFLLGTSIKMHDFWNDKDPQAKSMNQIQFNKNMALLGAALMMLAIPMPWMYSL